MSQKLPSKTPAKKPAKAPTRTKKTATKAPPVSPLLRNQKEPPPTPETVIARKARTRLYQARQNRELSSHPLGASKATQLGGLGETAAYAPYTLS